MQVKVIPAQKILAKEVRTSFADIASAIGGWPIRLWEEVEQNHLQVVGPAVYSYVRRPESGDKGVDLRIGIPVADFAGYAGEFLCMELPEFHCVEAVYMGSMLEVGSEGWAPLVQRTMQNRITPGTEMREVYLRWVGPQSPDNQVLLQLGVLPG